MLATIRGELWASGLPAAQATPREATLVASRPMLLMIQSPNNLILQYLQGQCDEHVGPSILTHRGSCLSRCSFIIAGVPMIRTLASLLGDWQRAVTVVLGVGAAAGWGMLAVSSQSAAETERQLQEWVATLQDSQKQLLLERDRSQVASAEVARLRDQLNSAQAEIARLAQGRTQAQLREPVDRLPVDGSSSPARLSQSGVSQTGSIRSLPPTPPQAPPRPAQAVPTKQGGTMVVQAGDRKRQGPEQAPVLKPGG